MAHHKATFFTLSFFYFALWPSPCYEVTHFICHLEKPSSSPTNPLKAPLKETSWPAENHVRNMGDEGFNVRYFLALTLSCRIRFTVKSTLDVFQFIQEIAHLCRHFIHPYFKERGESSPLSLWDGQFKPILTSLATPDITGWLEGRTGKTEESVHVEEASFLETKMVTASPCTPTEAVLHHNFDWFGLYSLEIPGDIERKSSHLFFPFQNVTLSDTSERAESYFGASVFLCTWSSDETGTTGAKVCFSHVTGKSVETSFFESAWSLLLYCDSRQLKLRTFA